jgi:hypothetical protein
MSADIAGILATAITALAPDLTGLTASSSDFVWLFRGLLLASLMLNLHFLRKLYVKVGRVDSYKRQIATIIVAVQYLAREAVKHEGRRESDSLVLNLLDDVKKLNEADTE